MILVKKTGHHDIFFVFLIALFFFTSTIGLDAQSDASGRVLSAGYSANRLLVQVVIPNDTEIESAFVLFDNEQWNADISSPVGMEQWFVLSAGHSMIDSYGLVGDEVVRYAQSKLPDSSGMIVYGEEIATLDATDNIPMLEGWLASNYNARPGASFCLRDALEQLPERSPDVARRITVITGDSESESFCRDIPEAIREDITLLVISNRLQNPYQSLSDRVNVRQASLRTVSSVLEVAQAEEPELRQLSVTVSEEMESAEIVVNFVNGQSFRESIVPQGSLTAGTSASPEPVQTVEASPAVGSSSAPTEIAIASPPVSSQEERTETGSSSPGMANTILITGGGLAAIIVVVIVMYFLLGNVNRSMDDTAQTDPKLLDGTLISTSDSDLQLDRTQFVTMRELAEQLGPTLVAQLVNQAEDTVYEIHRPASILGRQPGSDILIAGDDQISRSHARFTVRDNGTVWMTRMTRNPILINGDPVETSRELQDGDQIQISPRIQVIFKYLKPGDQD